MDLHEFNARLLMSLGVIDEGEDGYLSRVIDGSTTPYVIKGKRLVLPTPANLRNGDDNTIVFHPLSENITRGESDVIKSLRDTIMYELTMRAITLILELSRVAATPSEHGKIGSAAGKYLKDVTDLDEKVYLFIKDQLIPRIGPKPEARLISISLHKANQKAGALRTAKFKFPVLDSLMSDDMKILGAKIPSQKARKVIRTMFQIVLGDEETREGFDYGSKNQVAPYFHALMNGFINMATHLNSVIKQHKKLLGDLADDLTIDLSWVEGMDDLASLRKVVPPQEGNEGSLIISSHEDGDEAPAPADTRTVTRKVATNLLPRDRAERVSKAAGNRADSYDDEPLPWEDESPRPRRPRNEDRGPGPKHGKTLDDFLGGKGRGRDHDDRRDDRFGRGRDDRGFGRGHDVRESRFGGGRSYDLGLDSDRGASRFGREERGFGRGRDIRDSGGFGRSREFGMGSRSGRRSSF